MYLTNAQRADLIDALHAAAEYIDSDLGSNFPPFRRDWTKAEHLRFSELDSQRKRFRKLRRAYLAEERNA